jgi:hypothetical protein
MRDKKKKEIKKRLLWQARKSADERTSEKKPPPEIATVWENKIRDANDFNDFDDKAMTWHYGHKVSHCVKVWR